MNKLTKAIKFYSEHPYEFVTGIIGIKECSVSEKEWYSMTDEEKDKYRIRIQANPEVTWQQKKVLDTVPMAIKERKGMAVRSGHGIGKTAIESWIINWWLSTHPFSKCPCTAPTQPQLYNVLWSELSKWHKKNKMGRIFEWTKTHFVNKRYPELWFAVARTSNKPDAMQGFHGKYLLFIVEEASGVPEDVLSVIEGTQTQENALTMMFGNPTQISGGFYDAFSSKRKFFYTFTLNSEDSPLVRKEWWSEKLERYGRDSDFYRVRVLGEFPKAEPDTLIPIDRCEKAAKRELPEPDIRIYEDVEIGVDVARYGDDETVIMSRINNIITEETYFRHRDIMSVTGEVVKVIRKYKGKNITVNIDDSGLGGGVTDRLIELAKEGEFDATIVGVNNGSRAKETEKYINKGTEMWFYMREWLLEGKIPEDNDLIAQLSSRKYGVNSPGKHVLESKEHMKQRGIVSPDRADAAILTLHSLIYKQTKSRANSMIA